MCPKTWCALDNPPFRCQGHAITLRDWKIEDIPRLRDVLQPANEWHRFNGPYYPIASSEEIEQNLERMEQRVQDGDWPTPRQVVAIADAESDQLLGRANWYWQSEETHWLSLGIVIFESGRWSRGLGYEALGLWSESVLEAMPELVRLDLRTWSGNIGMMRLAEKLGYRLEARFRRARIVDGQYYDGLGYGILREEWQSRYPQGFVQSLMKPNADPD